MLLQNWWIVLLVIFIIGLLLSTNQQENFFVGETPSDPMINRLMRLYNNANDKGLKKYIKEVRSSKKQALKQALSAKRPDAYFNKYLMYANLLNLIRLAIEYRPRDKENHFEQYLTNMGLYVSKEQRKEWRHMNKLHQKQWEHEFRWFLQDDDYMVEEPTEMHVQDIEEPTEMHVQDIEEPTEPTEMGPCKQCVDKGLPECRYGKIPKRGPERIITQEDGSQCYCPGFYKCF